MTSKQNRILGVGVFFVFLGLFCIYFIINEKNYEKKQEITASIIEHPEFLPDSRTTSIASSGFQPVTADMYWLHVVQYIGENVLSEAYKRYLASLTLLITDLDPHFLQSYTTAQLLLPEDRSFIEKEKRKLYNSQALEIGLKGMENTCDMKKVQSIFKESNLKSILSSKMYSNPCISYKIPYYQAFTEYFYLSNYEKAANYYKVVAAQEDAPTGAKNLAAIMTGKSGARETSLKMFLSLASTVKTQDEVCTGLSMQIESIYNTIKMSQQAIPGGLIQELGVISKQFAPEVTEKNESEILKKTECTNYTLKAIRELNLLYLEEAANKYIDDGNDPKNISPEYLYQTGYISYIPQDFQRYTDSDQGIIYQYDNDLGVFDYAMGIIE